MTRYDKPIAARILAGLVVLGLALGMLAGSQAEADTGRETPQGDTLPGYQDAYVNDYADLLSDAAENRVRADLIGLYLRTGIEMTVLTIEAMGDYGGWTSIEGFAMRLFNTWGIGDDQSNDGVLILVSRDDRQMRIELGAGYGHTRNDDMKRVIDDVFIPDFKNDEYQRGIEAGVAETIKELTENLPGG